MNMPVNTEPTECDITSYVESLLDTNKRLSKAVKLQLDTIGLLQENNEKLVGALDLAIKVIQKSNPNHPLLGQLMSCLY